MKDTINFTDLTAEEVISAVEWLETQKRAHLDEIKCALSKNQVQSWLDNEAQASWISEEPEFQELIGACEYALGYYEDLIGHIEGDWKHNLMNIHDKALDAESIDVFQADSFWKNARWLIDNEVILVRPIRSIPLNEL